MIQYLCYKSHHLHHNMSGKESPRRKSVSKLSSRKEKVSICVENCKYAVVPAAAKILGWKAVDTKFDWDILWGDTGFNVGKFYKLVILFFHRYLFQLG